MAWLQSITIDRTLWVALGVASAVMFVGTLVCVPWLVARLHVDYFVGPNAPQTNTSRHPGLRLAGGLLRNLVGAFLVVMGLLMLVLPGQGILTLLVGLALMQFPGKRRLEKKLAGQRHVRRSLDWLRKRAGKAVLRFDDDPRGEL